MSNIHQPNLSSEGRSNRTSPMASFLSPHEPNSKGERRVMVGVLIVSGAILILIALYYILNPREVIGESLVDSSSGSPLEVPSPNLFLFYLKPITILFVALIAFSYCFFGLIQRPILSKLPPSLLTVFLLISIIALTMSAYETLFNFTLWASILVKIPNPDQAVNTYPVDTVKISLVYATKTFVASVFVSYFAICAFRNSIDRAST